ATAALYVTRADTNPQSKNTYPLDADNRLSSAGRAPKEFGRGKFVNLKFLGAATSLKHANPRDLPSFPTTGLDNGHSSAGAAASHANANHQDFKYWKPDSSEPASRAAAAAKDYKAAPLWHPESSGVGSKAAHAASKDEPQVDIWKPESTSYGNSAAGQAMRAKGLSPQAFDGVGADESRKALIAATGAVAGSGRRRAGSLPSVYPQYPDSANSAANALKAATSVSKPSSKSSQTKSDEPKAAPLNVGRIHNAAVTNLSREMYTSSPPVKPELEERNRQAGLRAAALSMAKQMYDVQQKAIDEAAHDGKEEPYYAAAAANVHNRQPSVASSEDYPPAPQYVNLQEAAQKLASERLAKLHDEHAAFRSYYGANTPERRRLSIRGRLRRRASSHGATPDSDEERSQTIRSEMSLFRNELAQVDAQKKQKDRDALLMAAQRNVRASMHGMDEK
ncbi:MAG: hypothetical protein Q9214_007452, partial [Letrouitia sp. 1 TL-2023]